MHLQTAATQKVHRRLATDECEDPGRRDLLRFPFGPLQFHRVATDLSYRGLGEDLESTLSRGRSDPLLLGRRSTFQGRGSMNQLNPGSTLRQGYGRLAGTIPTANDDDILIRQGTGIVTDAGDVIPILPWHSQSAELTAATEGQNHPMSPNRFATAPQDLQRRTILLNRLQSLQELPLSNN